MKLKISTYVVPFWDGHKISKTYDPVLTTVFFFTLGLVRHVSVGVLRTFLRCGPNIQILLCPPRHDFEHIRLSSAPTDVSLYALVLRKRELAKLSY